MTSMDTCNAHHTEINIASQQVLSSASANTQVWSSQSEAN